jgi:hypothetical protein
MNEANLKYLVKLETRIAELEKKLEEYDEVKHICATCWWFEPRKPRGNRYCQCPEEIVYNTKLNECEMWKLQPERRKRQRGIVANW